MPIDIETFKKMDKKKTNLESVVNFLKEDGRAWSISELANKLDLDPAIVSQISRKYDEKEVIRKQDGRRVWVLFNKGGSIITKKTGKKAKDLQQLINDFLNDKIAQKKVAERNLICEDIRKRIHDNITVDEFQELISILRGESNSIRNNRFANRVNTQEKLDSLLDALKSSNFENAADRISKVEGIGMEVLSMMLHITHPNKYHCVNGHLVRVIDRMIEKDVLPKENLHKYTSCKTPSGLKGFVNTYEVYERILNRIQGMGKMTKSQTDFFIGWVDHDIRRRYRLGDVSLSGL